MGHVGKSPAIGDFADPPVALQWIFQRLPAAGQASCLNETRERRALLCKHGIRVSHANSGGSSYCLRVESGIGKSRFNRGAKVHQSKRPGDETRGLLSIAFANDTATRSSA